MYLILFFEKGKLTVYNVAFILMCHLAFVNEYTILGETVGWMVAS